MTISEAKRQQVRQLYDYQCGYCGIAEADIGGELEVDHYRPITQDGTDEMDNLVYACPHCNRFKGSYWPSSAAPDTFYLLHPEEDDFNSHVELAENGRFVGVTSRGWFHIRWLHLNRPQLVRWRREKQKQMQLNEALQQARVINQQLQQRIRELEQDVALLQAQIARLINKES